MNQLSWLLYLGELSASFAALLWLLFFGAIIFFVARLLVVGIHNDNLYSQDKRWSYFWYPKTCATVLLLSAVIATALPSKNTVYAIAASEIGGKALMSPLAQKTEKALEVWLDKQIKPENKE